MRGVGLMSQKKISSKQSSAMDGYHWALLFLYMANELKQTNQKLELLSQNDSLTNISNRKQFEEDLKREIARVTRFNRKLALLYIDIDHFHTINDSFGYDVGDLLLQEIAKRLKNTLRLEDFAARIGGDQFAVILTEVTSSHDAGIVAHRIIDTLKRSYEIDDRTIIIGVDIGIACYPDAGHNVINLNKNASLALANAKASGRDQYQFFTQDMFVSHTKRLETEANLHFALERNEFYLVYQPRFDLQSQKMVGMEVLIRWQHPQHGNVPPLDFIPIAEETGLIVPIGRWVLLTACKQFSMWREKFANFNLVMAVNISPKQVQNPNFVDYVFKALNDFQIPPHLLELEITETAVTHFLGKIENNLFQLRNVGVQFSIDDFGAGYSSFTRLKELPIQSIKIDKSFVSDIDGQKADNVIIKSTLVLAKDIGLNVIAEGVETESQSRFLEKNNCPQAQGFYYSKPLTAEEMEKFIKTHMNIDVS